MSRRDRNRRPAAHSPAVAPRARTPVDHSWALFGIACGSLLLARFLLPAESADEGETLGIVVGWLVTATLALWVALREERYVWQPTRPEGAVVCLALPQIVSSLLVLAGAGDKRAALNMLWEWVGVVVAFFLLRVWCTDGLGRRRVTSLLIAVGVLLGGVGVWQRYVWYPQIQAAYREWQELTSGDGAAHAETRQRTAELERELGPDLLALTGSSQAALKQRILDSTEPFGRFGLANTFAGVLAVVLILLVGCRPRPGPGGWFVWGATLVLVALSLLLTRSRTAWLATLCGLAWLAITSGSGLLATSSLRRAARVLVVAALAVIPLGALALAFGAIDRQDLIEAPKSVQYRLQYWTSTWPMIREHPWFGVGPGNFRQHYLPHKLPEASEEISDPHNLALDLWASGGLFGLLGLLAVGRLALRRWNSDLAADSPSVEEASAADDPPDAKWLCLVGWLTCGLLFVTGYFFDNRLDRELSWLALGWLPCTWMADRLWRSAAAGRWAVRGASAAALALGVHLLTSGGIAMPVITLLGLTLLFVIPDDRRPELASPYRGNARLGRVLAIAGALLLAGCLWSGWGPVTIASLQMAGGVSSLRIEHRPTEAVELFHKATESDPLNPATWRELAFAEAALWQRGGRDAERHFTAAVEAVDRLIAADPDNAHVYRLRGDLWLDRHRRTLDPEDAERAVAAYQQAAARYPNSAPIQMELARALKRAGETAPARLAARRALELDDLFIAAGHYDKMLRPNERQELTELAERR